MASNEPEPSDGPIYEVEDTEGFVNRKKKKMILKSRERVDDIEARLMLYNPSQLDVSQQTAYHQMIRQFLRHLEPLLSNPEVNGATEAYTETHLGNLIIEPPVDPNIEEKPDHLKDTSEKSFFEEKSDSDLVLHRFSDPVEPVRFEITGLEEIINNDGRTASWEVIIDKKESRGFRGAGLFETTVTESQQWNYTILNNAVRVADQFLENANIGLSLSEGEPDDGFLDL